MALRPCVACALFAILIAGQAAAADLGGATPTALKFDDSAPAPIWTGLYVGANGGISIAADGTSNGFIGGAQVGYNYQLGHWIVGIEADIAYDRFLTSSVTSEASIAWVGSLRPRLGYAMGPLLFYGTGGLAYANPDLSTLSSSGADFRLGWVAGAGIDTAAASATSASGECARSLAAKKNCSAPPLTSGASIRAPRSRSGRRTSIASA
jgi:outer membrane immunogenic protein